MKCFCSEEGILDSFRRDMKINEELVEVKCDKEKWLTLYRCKYCGTYWERYHPHPECHGGGPSELRKVDNEYVKEKYEIDV